MQVPDDDDDDLNIPFQQPAQPSQGPQASGSNPFSPANGAQSNEGRLVQVLESMTLLLQNQAASAAANRPAVSGKDLSKIIKQPEPFSPKDRDSELSLWPAWSWQFEQWLGCVNRDFVQDLSRIRANLGTPIVQTTLTPSEQERSQLLFGILAGQP